MKSAIVFGWGAVEQRATQWASDARVVEVERRLWVVYSGTLPIGMIGKEPWSAEAVRIRAAALEEEG